MKGTHQCSNRAVSLACPDTQQDETGRVAPMLSEAPSSLLGTSLLSHSPRSPLKHRGHLVLSHHVHPGARSVLACPAGTTGKTANRRRLPERQCWHEINQYERTSLLKISDLCPVNCKSQTVIVHPSSTAASPRHKATLPHCPGWRPHSQAGPDTPHPCTGDTARPGPEKPAPRLQRNKMLSLPQEL